MPSERVTRRSVLATAAGLALPAFVPRSAWGAGERIRLGLIGTANRGMQNLGMVRADVVAVCDVDERHLARAREAVVQANGGSCAAYGDYRRLLEDRNVDAVVISTPDHWHALQTVHACEAGKDVYCEKPLTLTIREGQVMLQTARRTGRIVQTGSQQRSDPRFRRVVELVREGRFGKLQSIQVGISRNNFQGAPVPDGEPPAELNYDLWLGPAPYRPYNERRLHYNFRFFWDYSGGQMTNWGAHHLDIAQWALGEDAGGPVSVEGTAEFTPGVPYEVPDRQSITYRYASGVIVRCGQEFRQGVTFETDRGTVFVNRGRCEAKPAELLPEEFASFQGSDFTRQHFENWKECIRSRKLPTCDVEIGHRSATVCHLGNIASRAGRRITWDPKAEKVVGDEELQARTHKPYRSPWKL